MALHANAIVSQIEDARRRLNVQDNSVDADIEGLINALTLTFETEARCPIKERALTGYRIDGNGKREIVLPIAPVQSITKVDIRYPSDDTVYKTVTDSTKFVLKDKRLGLLLMVEDTLLQGMRNVLIDMSVGFAASSIEFLGIQELLLQQMKASWRLWKNGELGQSSRTYADGTVAFFPPNLLLKEIRDGLVAIKDWS